MTTDLIYSFTSEGLPDVVDYDYQPTKRQQLFHNFMVDELMYGGSAGGGKSRAIRAEAFQFALQFPGSRQLILRRTFPDLERNMVEPLRQEIPSLLGKYNSTKHIWSFINGSILELGHLQRKSDLLKYQGAEYQAIYFDELTHFEEEQFDYMKSRLRSSGLVAERMTRQGARPALKATTNPGGPGHGWVKRRFVDPAPAGTPFKRPASDTNPKLVSRLYIPARASDNPYLNAEYMDQLDALPEHLRKALRDGDWNILEGVRFPSWREDLHVVTADINPKDLAPYRRCVAIDYGFSAPFAAVWMAKISEESVLIYREAEEKELTATEQAELIRDMEVPGERTEAAPIPIVMDPAMWRRDNAGTITGAAGLPPKGSPAHDYMQVFGQAPIKAHNNRVAGWAQVDKLLAIDKKTGFPRLQVFDTCRKMIEYLPSAPRDTRNPEDIDTTWKHDHEMDALRYGLMYLAGYSQTPSNMQGPTTIKSGTHKILNKGW